VVQGRSAAVDGGYFFQHLGPGMTVLDCGCGPGSITAVAWTPQA
jgi:cyclopropane fatty-acyl-phospholipid synthase-like methyltransferase